MIKQGMDLAQKPHIVIATPGRLADHIDSGTDFSLKRVRFLVSKRLATGLCIQGIKDRKTSDTELYH